MKKTILAALLILTVLVLAACDAVTVGAFSSKYFNSDEHQAAVNEVMTCAKALGGVTLKRIDYVGDKALEAEAEERGTDAVLLMILESTLTTDGEDHGNGLEPNRTYEHYRWVLTRATTSDPFWEIVEHGPQ